MIKVDRVVRASRVGGSVDLRGDQYRCLCCGHVAKFNASRGRPRLCHDCMTADWRVA